MVDVLDLLQMRVFQLRHGVEARHHLALFLERGLQPAQRLHVRLGAHVLVAVEDRQAVLVAHGDDGAGEAAFGPGAGGAFLALDGIGVDVVAGKAVFGGDDVGRDALRHEVGLHREARVDRDRCAVRAHRHAAHHLDPAGDIGLAGAAIDLVGGQVHRLEPRGAEAVDREARHGFVEIAGQHGRARQAAALFAHLGGVAPDHVLDGCGVQVVALLDRVQGQCRQPQAGDLLQRAVLAALAAGGAQRVVDIGIRHGSLLE